MSCNHSGGMDVFCDRSVSTVSYGICRDISYRFRPLRLHLPVHIHKINIQLFLPDYED